MTSIYTPVKRLVNGITERSSVKRPDGTPLGDAGDQMLLVALQAGQLSTVSQHTNAAIVGQLSANLTLATSKDFNNVAAQITPAPLLESLVRTKPRLDGIDYPFVDQTAINTARLDRLPAFTLHPSWEVTYGGSHIDTDAYRSQLLTRGFGSVGDTVPDRGRITRNKLNLCISGGYDIALLLVNGRKNPDGSWDITPLDPGDVRRQWLLEWGNAPHKFIDHQGAARLLGERSYIEYQNSDWTNGAPLFGISPNFEIGIVSPNSSKTYEDQWWAMQAGVMEGVKAAALARNQTPPAFWTFDIFNMSAYSLSLLSKDQDASGQYTQVSGSVPYIPELGVPYYFNVVESGLAFRGGTKNKPLFSNNPATQYLLDNGGYCGGVSYYRNTWDDGSMWQKNADGTFKTKQVNGKTRLMTRSDDHSGTIGGEIVDLLGAGFYSESDADNLLYYTYQRFQIAVTDMYRISGGIHVPRARVRMAGYEKIKLSQWNRWDTEFINTNQIQNSSGTDIRINPRTGIKFVPDVMNTRPLNGDIIEGDLIGQLLLGRQGYRYWMGPQSKLSAQGAATTNGYLNHSMQCYERAARGMHRLSSLNWTQDNDYQYLLPDYWIRNIHRDRTWYDPTEDFEYKPILFGGLCDRRADRDNKPYVWIFGWFPGQDVDKTVPVKYWWVDANGAPITGSYSFRLRGRNPYIEDHQVPDVVIGLPASRFRIQYTDLMGGVHVRTGNYTDSRPGDTIAAPAEA